MKEYLSNDNQLHVETAIFAGGCFWCIEGPFEVSTGVKRVEAGYTGGTAPDPSYEDYARSGHVEAIRITFDPAVISYSGLLEIFWRQIDPTDDGGQFVDRGKHYRSAIFYMDENQKRIAEQSKSELAAAGLYTKPVVTEIIKAQTFYPAEEYHQHYHAEHPERYAHYRSHSGRDEFLQKIWGNNTRKKSGPSHNRHFAKPTDGVLKTKISPLSYRVTQQNGTEPPFANEFWDNKREGIYADIVSGEVLFSSRDKFDSGTGWPSFTKPVDPDVITVKTDSSLGTERTEVRSAAADSHLGHVFDDGPAPAHKRYCMNSASLRFIAKEDLEREGYEEYLSLFE